MGLYDISVTEEEVIPRKAVTMLQWVQWIRGTVVLEGERERGSVPLNKEGISPQIAIPFVAFF